MTVELKPEKKIFQSASRNETYLDCSQKYAAKYILKFPDPGNEGSGRGSTVHDVLELLLKPKHEKLYSSIIHRGTCRETPAVWKLLSIYAKKYKVFDDENMEMIDQFMMVALNSQFKGPKNTVETLGEKEFSIEFDSNGKKYSIKGFIDKTFLIGDKEGAVVALECVDYKSSKKKFDNEKVDNNMQASVYQLALRHLYPHVKDRKFKFLFMKFKKDPWVELPSLTDDQLNGFEWFLTEMQSKLESFTIANANDNLAAFNDEKKWLCGRDGLKKDGTPNFICPQRKPADYWVAINEQGEIVESAFDPSVLKFKQGVTLQKMRYGGCPAFYGKDEKPRSFS